MFFCLTADLYLFECSHLIVCKIEISNLAKVASEKTSVLKERVSLFGEYKRLYDVSLAKEREQEAIVRKSESIVNSLEKRREVMEGLVNDAAQKLVQCRRELIVNIPCNKGKGDNTSEESLTQNGKEISE